MARFLYNALISILCGIGAVALLAGSIMLLTHYFHTVFVVVAVWAIIHLGYEIAKDSGWLRG